MDTDTFTSLSLCFFLLVLFTIYNWYKFCSYKKRKEAAGTDATLDKEEMQFATAKYKQFLKFSLLMTAFTILTFVAIFMLFLEVT